MTTCDQSAFRFHLFHVIVLYLPCLQSEISHAKNTTHVSNLIDYLLIGNFMRDFCHHFGWSDITLLTTPIKCIKYSEFLSSFMIKSSCESQLDNDNGKSNFVLLMDDFNSSKLSALMTDLQRVQMVTGMAAFLLIGRENLQLQFNKGNFHWYHGEISDSKEIEVWDVYTIGTTEQLLREKRGSWATEKGLHLELPGYLGPHNFHAQEIRIVTVHGPPFVFLQNQKGKITAYGYLIDLIDAISKKLNFSYTILPSPDGSFGSLQTDGKWTGMVGAVQRHEADIAMHSLSVTRERQQVLDFSPPIEHSGMGLLMQRDSKKALFNWNAYFLPFSLYIWIACALMHFVFSACLWLLNMADQDENWPHSFTESMWTLYGGLVQQGAKCSPNTLRSKLVYGMYWLFTVILFSSYTARLTAHLTNISNELPVKSLSQAVRSGHWTIGTIQGSSMFDKISQSETDDMRLLARKVREPNMLVPNFEAGVERVYTDPSYLFFTSEPIPKYLTRNNCSFIWVPGKFFEGYGYMGYRKGLPYKEAISHYVSMFKESGQMKYQFHKWWASTKPCTSAKTSEELGLPSTVCVFCLLMAGFLLSITLVFIENMYYRKQW